MGQVKSFARHWLLVVLVAVTRSCDAFAVSGNVHLEWIHSILTGFMYYLGV
jgi:polysaccharide pyruvyl transferase WcaK-like protein